MCLKNDLEMGSVSGAANGLGAWRSSQELLSVPEMPI